MSLPGQHLAGQFVHSIRRTAGRHYFLRPGFRSNWTFSYAFAVAVEESGVVPSAELIMSNHRHGGLLDRFGRRAHFHERYHGMVGAAMNGLLGRRGNHFWDNRGPTGIVVLFKEGKPPVYEDEDEEVDAELEAMFDELGLDTQDRVLLYVWMNPVKANLVERLRDYPGFVVGPDDWGKERVVLRPPWFGMGYPPEGRFTPMPPRKWEGRLEEARAHYKGLIRQCEEFYRERRRRQGKGVFGARNLLKQDPYTRPRTVAKVGRTPRFCGSSKLRVKAIEAYGVWRDRYEVARRKFRNGERDVVFPAGTVGLRRIAGVRCRGGPLPDENPMP